MGVNKITHLIKTKLIKIKYKNKTKKKNKKGVVYKIYF